MNRTAALTLAIGSVLLAAGVLAYVAVGGVGGLAARFGAGQGDVPDVNQHLHQVAKGTLDLTVACSGRVRAAASHRISPTLTRGRATITWVVPEGTEVKVGEPLATFDTAELEQWLRTSEADLAAAEKQLIVAEEAVKIQRSTNASLVTAAKTKFAEAEVALTTYRSFDGPKRLNDIAEQLLQAEQKLREAEAAARELQSRLDASLFNEDERDALQRELDEQSQIIDTATRAVEAINVQRRIFRAYEYPQTLAARREAVSNAEMEVERSELAGNSELLQKEAEVSKVRDQVSRLRGQIENIEEQIKSSKLVSPVAGVVLYGGGDRQSLSAGSPSIAAGQQWYPGNVLLTVPDMSQIVVDVEIPEEYRARVRKHAPCSVTLDAIPGLLLSGELTGLGTIAIPRYRFDPSGPKVFEGVVTPTSTDQRIVSGMTARVQVKSETVEDALLLPIEAAYNDGGEIICYVHRRNLPPERRVIEVGRSNEHYLEVTAGLAEGVHVGVGGTNR